MYIEYASPQWMADLSCPEDDTTGGEFRPTWLIRTSDWQRVPGKEATNGYCTLSYCWEQSGEKVQQDDGEYILRDNGLHRIKTRSLERRKTRRSTRYRWRIKSRHVQFEGIIQEICTDFDIDYIWYDKVCIDQINKEVKHNEIKNMHLIYSNARYTVALVPEVDIEDPEQFEEQSWRTGNSEAKETALNLLMDSLWWKRSWTLEELMMSTQLLVIGRNTHFWCFVQNTEQGQVFYQNDFLSLTMLGFASKKMKSANQVIRHAHFRSSTKTHDIIYALANIFHGTVTVDIDYQSDALVAMYTFYRQLAECDLSVMCFGSVMQADGNPKFWTTMDSYGLPSWTGAAGLHSPYPVVDTILDTNASSNVDVDMRIHLKCRSHTIRPTKYVDHIFEQEEREQQAQENYDKVISSMDDFNGDESAALDWAQWTLDEGSHGLATHFWKPDHHVFRSPILPLSLTEDCDECIIPAILFDSAKQAIFTNEGGGYTITGYDHDYFLPILKKSEKSPPTYKAIGIILLKHFQYHEAHKSPRETLDDIFGNTSNETQEFIIE